MILREAIISKQVTIIELDPMSEYKRNLIIDSIRCYSRLILLKDYPAVLGEEYTIIKMKYDEYQRLENKPKLIFLK